MSVVNKSTQNMASFSRLVNSAFSAALVFIGFLCFFTPEAPPDAPEEYEGQDFPNRSKVEQECPTIVDEMMMAYQTEGVRPLSQRLIRHPGHFGLPTLADVFDHFRGWATIPDSYANGAVANPVYSFQYREGTSRDYSLAVAAFITATGGRARIVIQRAFGGQYHVFPEAMLPDELPVHAVTSALRERYGISPGFSPTYRLDEDGHRWLNLDMTAPWPGGPYQGQWKEFILVLPTGICSPLP